MAFIRAQRVIRDESGRIIAGSATIRESVYVKTGKKSHSRQIQREKLGKVIWLSPDKKSGIFLSPTRGLVEYRSKEDVFLDVDKNDERLTTHPGLFPNPEVHTTFGDSHLLLSLMKSMGMIDVLKEAFPDVRVRQRLMAHILHTILKDSSRITCDCFLEKSMASHLLDEVPAPSLRSDTGYFSLMGRDSTRMDFFRAFVSQMKRRHEGFGQCCYVDSSPLPNDIFDNPFNALCSHGVGQASVQVRLVIVLDKQTGLPVWFAIIPGNVLDINTLNAISEDVQGNLGIEINSFVLDAGYVSKELIEAYHIGTRKTFLGRMPAKKGYPFKELYKDVKPLIGKGKYQFVRERHVYFGYKKKVTVFGRQQWAYVYVDKNNALQRSRDWMVANPEEYQKLKDYEKDWLEVQYGFFVLITNVDSDPKSILDEYFGRSYIESVIKTGKEYLGLLPLSKWTMDTVRGKILHDMISLIIYLQMRTMIAETGESVSYVLGKMQSLMCFKARDREILIETPNKQVKQYYNTLGIKIPSHLNVTDFKREMMLD